MAALFRLVKYCNLPRYMFLWLSIQLGMECHHPNWRSPSFFRGVGIPPTRRTMGDFHGIKNPTSLGFLFFVVHSRPSPCLAFPRLPSNSLSHTHNSHTQLNHNNLLTHTHTQNFLTFYSHTHTTYCHTHTQLSHTHNFLTHNLLTTT